MVSPLSAGSSRPRWLVPVAVAVGILIIIVLPLVSSYNGMVNKQSAVDQSFADLDSQLQRRNDLIPNLVGAVRGILGQEQAVFGALAQARSHYAGASSPTDKIAAANQVDSAISRLLVIVEAYPQLKSAQNVQDLQIQLEGTENRIAQARRDYNAVTTAYNISIRHFPRSLVAGMFGFTRKPLFQATTESRNVPPVDLGPAPTASTTPTSAGP
jgi:LemA protein